MCGIRVARTDGVVDPVHFGDGIPVALGRADGHRPQVVDAGVERADDFPGDILARGQKQGVVEGGGRLEDGGRVLLAKGGLDDVDDLAEFVDGFIGYGRYRAVLSIVLFCSLICRSWIRSWASELSSVAAHIKSLDPTSCHFGVYIRTLVAARLGQS